MLHLCLKALCCVVLWCSLVRDITWVWGIEEWSCAGPYVQHEFAHKGQALGGVVLPVQQRVVGHLPQLHHCIGQRTLCKHKRQMLHNTLSVPVGLSLYTYAGRNSTQTHISKRMHTKAATHTTHMQAHTHTLSWNAHAHTHTHGGRVFASWHNSEEDAYLKTCRPPTPSHKTEIRSDGFAAGAKHSSMWQLLRAEGRFLERAAGIVRVHVHIHAYQLTGDPPGCTHRRGKKADAIRLANHKLVGLSWTDRKRGSQSPVVFRVSSVKQQGRAWVVMRQPSTDSQLLHSGWKYNRTGQVETQGVERTILLF